MSTTPIKKKKPGQSVWPTLWAILPIEESDRALNAGGTIGFAIYAALHLLRFKAPRAHRAAFFCSGQNVSKHSGISVRRVWDPLRRLESAGLIKVERPAGKSRLEHGASKISILPVFTRGNKVGDDAESLPNGTARHDGKRQQDIGILAHIAESPLTGGDSSIPATLALVGAASRDESKVIKPRGAKTIATEAAIMSVVSLRQVRYNDILNAVMPQEIASSATVKNAIRNLKAQGQISETSGIYHLPGNPPEVYAPKPRQPPPASIQAKASPAPAAAKPKPEAQAWVDPRTPEQIAAYEAGRRERNATADESRPHLVPAAVSGPRPRPAICLPGMSPSGPPLDDVREVETTTATQTPG